MRKRIIGYILAAAMALSLAGCNRGKPTADIASDGTIRSVAKSSYANVLVQLGFSADAGSGFYEFYYETDGQISHVYDVSASFVIQDQQVSTSGEVWSDGVTAYSTSGRGWQETGIPMRMDIATLPGTFGYTDGLSPKMDDEYYIFEWETDLAGIASCGLLSLVGDLDGLELSGPADAALRVKRSDGSFVSLCVNADSAAICVLLNHVEDGKILEIPSDVMAPSISGTVTDTPETGVEDGEGAVDEGEPSEAMAGLKATIAANDEGLNLLEIATDHGTEYLYYESNRANRWYGWAEISRPLDGDVAAAFAERKAAMETVLGSDVYEENGSFLMYVQRSNPNTEDGLNAAGDQYVYLLARNDEFVLNFTIQDWTSKNLDGVMANARTMLDRIGQDWHA